MSFSPILSPEEFSQLFTTFTTEAFRFESWPHLRDPKEQKAVDAYLQGQVLPAEPYFNEEWLMTIRAAKQRGASMRRVRILPEPLTPFVHFEIDWGYGYSALAGEEVRLLRRHEVPESMLKNDFWLFDNTVGIWLVYEDDGTFKHAQRAEEFSCEHMRKSKALWESAQPFEEYLRLVRNT